MTYLVTAPVKDFNGVVSNQVFVDGIAEVTDPTVLWYFREAGYTVDEIPDELADLADLADQDPDDADPTGADGTDPDAANPDAQALGGPVTPEADPNLVNPLEREPGSQPVADPDAGDQGDGSQAPADQGASNPAELDKPLDQRRIDQLKAFAAEQDPPIELGTATKRPAILATIQAELEKRAAAGDPGDGSDSGDSAGGQPAQPTA